MPLRLIPFFLALAWGLNWPAVKIALAEIAPFTLLTTVADDSRTMLSGGLAPQRL